MKLNWRDASKELPEEDADVLAFDDNCHFFITQYSHEDDEWISSCFVIYWLPVSEIPLPEK